jgi:ribonuclease P protein component
LPQLFPGFFPLKNKVRQTKPPRRATFPVRARLIKPIEFKRVFRNSVVSSDRCFKVLARRNESDCSRLGMAVSRQVDRHAVGRNRIKRVIRESFRQSFEAVVSESTVSEAVDKPDNESKAGAIIEGNYPGIDIVVLPRREAATICNHQLFQSLQAHWSCLKKKTGIKQETE